MDPLINQATHSLDNGQVSEGRDASSMISASTPTRFVVGSGNGIYEKTLIPAIRATERELIFVTCFWAASSALTQLSASLIHLSEKALLRANGSTIRVRLCFSSRSFLQRISHTSSPNGYVYPPSKWVSKLGLPPPDQLKGVDLQVKSIFIRPFSVLHPKFVIVDRERAFMPSCNLSWENWFEGCLVVKGPVVDDFFRFWQQHWAFDDPPLLPYSGATSASIIDLHERPIIEFPMADGTVLDLIRGYIPAASALFEPSTIPTILLPSPQHTFWSTFSFFRASPTPSTPLNDFLLDHFLTAQKSIRMVTPNLTSAPVLDALLAALARGVDVTITTSKRMMTLEQIVTAGTITELCVWKLVRAYRRLLQVPKEAKVIEEAQELGNLKISYFHRKSLSHCHPRAVREQEPVKSHLKCTIFDEKIVVLGSGNMDRASWYTSQELGIAVFGKVFANGVREIVEGCFRDRREKVYYERKGLL